MINVKKLKLEHEIKMNCYIINNSNEAIIIDPGFTDDKIIKYIDDNNLKVIAILLTHMHWDHIGGLNMYNVPIYIHEKAKMWYENDYKLMKDSQTKHNIEYDYRIEQLNINYFNSFSNIIISSFIFKTFYVPGHSPEQSAFLIDNYLFCGDTIFQYRVSKTQIVFGDYELQINSINNMINKISDNVIVHPGHGNSEYLDMIRINNKYLN